MGRNILVVEDDRNICDLIHMYLVKEGFDVRIAGDGGKAIEEFQKQVPDLILLDLGLPDIDGVEVIRRVRSWSNLPIIVISARSEDTDKIDALDAGADDYLTSPFQLRSYWPGCGSPSAVWMPSPEWPMQTPSLPTAS